MKSKIWILVVLLIIGQVQFIQAENAPMKRNELFLFLQDAFNAQLSLGDRYRTEKEVREVLSPYFTNEYQDLFMKEHIYSEPEGYILYGSDIKFYFIPMYSYDENTKIITEPNKIIVYEYFPPQLEGPVIWEQPQYEILTITRTKEGWRISDYNISVNKP